MRCTLLRGWWYYAIFILPNLSNAQPLFESAPAVCGITPPTEQWMRKYQQITANQDESGTRSLVCIPIKAHVFRKDDGTGGISLLEINFTLSYLNHYFQPLNVHFYWAGLPDYVNNSDYYDFDARMTDLNGPDSEGKLALLAQEANDAINLYFVHEIVFSDGSPVAGYAKFPEDNPSANRIIVANQYVISEPSGVLVHEMGHYFGLLHTHQDTEFGNADLRAENVPRSGPDCNCATTGDLICDTPADPRYDPQHFNQLQCSYDGDQTDRLGNPYSPPIHNIMSYYPDRCGGEFTPGQCAIMQQWLDERLSHTTYSLNHPPVAVQLPVHLNAAYQASSNGGFLHWNKTINAGTGYMIERSEGPDQGYVPLIGGATLPGDTFFIDHTIDHNKIYYYRLRSANDGCGEYIEAELNPNAGDNNQTVKDVVLTSFKAAPCNEGIKVMWQTNIAPGEDEFKLFYSSDGLHYELVGLIPGTALTQYAFMQNEIQAGEYFYRINLVKPDGEIRQLESLRGWFIPPAQLIENPEVHPNPASDYINLSFNTITSCTVELTLCNADGRILNKKRIQASKGNQQSVLDVRDLKDGIYAIRLQSDRSSKSIVFVKTPN